MCIFWKQLLISIICPYTRPEQHACNSRDTTTKYTERSPRIAHSPLLNYLKNWFLNSMKLLVLKNEWSFLCSKNLCSNVLPHSEREFLLKNNLLTSRDKNGNWDVINTATVVSDRW